MALNRKSDESDVEYQTRCAESAKRWAENEAAVRAEGISTNTYKTYFILSPNEKTIKIGKTSRIGNDDQDLNERIRHSVFYPLRRKLGNDLIFLGFIRGDHIDEFTKQFTYLQSKDGWFKIDAKMDEFIESLFPEKIMELKKKGF